MSVGEFVVGFVVLPGEVLFVRSVLLYSLAGRSW
jgi:hypothetical protein